MSDYERRRRVDDLCEHIDTLLETVCCQVCKWKSEFKDPDDLDKAHCSACIVWELGDDLKEETDGLV